MAGSITGGVVESIKLELKRFDTSKYDAYPGVDSQINNYHGYYAVLPSDYESKSNNHKADGSEPW